MKNKEESKHYFYYQNQDRKYQLDQNYNNPDWQFQKVQSILEVSKQPQIYKYEVNKIVQKNRDYNLYPVQVKKLNKYFHQQRQQRSNQQLKIRNKTEKFMRDNQKNKFSRSNIQTGTVSQNQSMQYNPSQQPSLYNKGQFTILEDFNMNNVSPLKKNAYNFENSNNNNSKVMGLRQQLRGIKNEPLNRNKIEWRIASFPPPTKKKVNQKIIKLTEYVQELKFMKEGLQSKLKQQKAFVSNELQQIKKFIFKLNIKYEKQLLEFSKGKNSQREKASLMRQSSLKSDQSTKEIQINQLKKYCQKLQQQKIRSQEKYQKTLKIYQEQIQSISHQFQRRTSLESNGPRFGTDSMAGIKCQGCTNLEQILHSTKTFSSAEIQIWKTRLQQQQQKHQKSMKKLQQKVYSLQDQFQFLQKNKNQIEKQLKNKQKQILHRQSQLEYQMKDIQRRQRDIQMRQKFLQKQKIELQRKKQKITDYELKILKEERRNQNQFKQKQMMASQYFSNCQKRQILVKNNRPPLQRSDSKSSRSSKIDINSRLRQIQMMRSSGNRNLNDNATSRNSSTDSRLSGTKQIVSPRINFNTNIRQYGVYSSQATTNKRQYGKQSNQMIKLSQKLSNLTHTIQKQLREIG